MDLLSMSYVKEVGFRLEPIDWKTLLFWLFWLGLILLFPMSCLLCCGLLLMLFREISTSKGGELMTFLSCANTYELYVQIPKQARS